MLPCSRLPPRYELSSPGREGGGIDKAFFKFEGVRSVTASAAPRSEPSSTASGLSILRYDVFGVCTARSERNEKRMNEKMKEGRRGEKK